MPNNAFSDAAFRATQTLGLPITRTLIDNTRLGSFWVRVLVAIGTGDTVIDHKLGRIPNGYIVMRAQDAGVVYDGTMLGADWTSTTITLRASVATNFTLLIG